MKKYHFLLGILLFFFTFKGYGRTIKGMWVVRYALKEPQQIERLIDVSQQIGCTDLFVQVWAKGLFLMRYPRLPEKQILAADPVFHNLQDLIAAAHSRGIRVHTWLNVLNIWSGSNRPQIKEHIFFKERQHIFQKDGGAQLPEYSTILKDGGDGYFISPASGYNLSLLKELIHYLDRHLHVDGIHLDYFRLPGGYYLFSQTSRSEYILQNYFDPITFFPLSDSQPKQQAATSRQRMQYRQFLSRQLTLLLTQIQDYVKSVNRELVLSIAVKPDLYRARFNYLQCWDEWLDAGLCDLIIPMNYVPDDTAFRHNMNLALQQEHPDKIAIGISTYNQTERMVKEKIKLVAQTPFRGYVLFSFNDLSGKLHNEYVIRYFK